MTIVEDKLSELSSTEDLKQGRVTTTSNTFSSSRMDGNCSKQRSPNDVL